jgi:predicted ABC-type ATPase
MSMLTPTTLASRSFAPFLRRIQGEGYLVRIIFVWLSSPDLAVQRVASRIQQGGHSVPEAVVQRRYWRGLANFIRLYRPLADTWIVCDNSGDGPAIVARGERDAAPVVSDQELYREIQRAAG